MKDNLLHFAGRSVPGIFSQVYINGLYLEKSLEYKEMELV